MAKPGKPSSAGNRNWSSRHRPPKHESELSDRNRANVKWYRRERARWIAALGGKCAVCGTTDELEFDHDAPRTWIANRTSRWQRLRNYIRDIRAGHVKQLLCRVHNSEKGRPAGEAEWFESESERRPF